MKNKNLVILWLLVGIGFVLRIWGTAGVYIRGDDYMQIHQAGIAYNEYVDADVGYPVFYQYVGGFILKALNKFLYVMGAIEKGHKKEWSYDEVAIIMRILSGFYGAISILLVYLIAKKLYDEKAALLSSFFLTFTFFHILTGHTALLDNQMGFFILLGFLFMVGIAKEGKTHHYLLAGLMTGFAISSKYNAVFLVFTLLISHIIRVFKKKRFWKILFDKNIILSGLLLIFGFFLGNPPAWMAFKKWSSGIVQLGRIIRQPDAWMVTFTFSNVWDFLKYNKYTGAILKIHYSIKISLLLLLFLGLFILIKRHKKEDILLLSFPFFYVILGLGIYEIIRERDHFALIPFYLMIASVAFLWLIEVTKKRVPSRKIHFLMFLILLILASYPSLKNAVDIASIFHERDTLEYGEEWIYENIPPKSTNVFEMYTPFVYTPMEKYQSIFPNRFRLMFYFIMGRWLRENPFDSLRKDGRFVHVSNLNPRRFIGIEKFYAKELSFYKRIFREFKVVKKFSLREVESKSPTLYIFTTKRLPLREIPLLFPEQLSLNQRETDIFFDDPGIYGKSNLIFVLEGRGAAERRILSRKGIKEFVVFLYGNGGEEVKILEKRTTLGQSGFAFVRLRLPKKTYPFSEPTYRIHIKSLADHPVLVKVHHDPLKIGYEFFKNGMFEEASRFFSAAREENPDNPDALLYLRETRTRMGKEIEKLSARDADRIHSIFNLQNMENWMKRMEKMTGIDVEFLIDSLSLYLEVEDLSGDDPVVHDPKFLNRKALLAAKPSRIELPFFLPQSYVATIKASNPEGPLTSDLKIFSAGRFWAPTKVDRGGDLFWCIEIPFQKDMDTASLDIDVKDSFLLLDSIWIRPDIRNFFVEKKGDLSFLSPHER